jgi:hypothetical protein
MASRGGVLIPVCLRAPPRRGQIQLIGRFGPTEFGTGRLKRLTPRTTEVRGSAFRQGSRRDPRSRSTDLSHPPRLGPATLGDRSCHQKWLVRTLPA